MKKEISIRHAGRLSAISTGMASISFGCAALSLFLIAVLHVLQPDFDPAWRFLSEYAHGRFGWVMRLSFFSMAASCASLFLAIRSDLKTLAGKAGLGFLLATVVGLTIAGLFAMDLITTPPDQATRAGSLHALGSMIGVPGLPIAALLISIGLARSPAWSQASRRLLWLALFMWLSLLLLFAVIGIMLPRAGGFGPDVWIGWPNRILMLSYGLWLMSAAYLSLQRQTE